MQEERPGTGGIVRQDRGWGGTVHDKEARTRRSPRQAPAPEGDGGDGHGRCLTGEEEEQEAERKNRNWGPL